MKVWIYVAFSLIYIAAYIPYQMIARPTHRKFQKKDIKL